MANAEDSSHQGWSLDRWKILMGRRAQNTLRVLPSEIEPILHQSVMTKARAKIPHPAVQRVDRRLQASTFNAIRPCVGAPCSMSTDRVPMGGDNFVDLREDDGRLVSLKHS